jgi:plastocyanin
MLQHILIILAGVLVAFPIYRKHAHSERRWLGRASVLAASGLIVFWHLPIPWDTAVLNPVVHLIEHLSFFAVGLMIGSWVLLLSDSAKIGALLTAFFGHMGYAVILVSPWNVQVYSLYSLPDQVILGWVLLLTGPSLIVGVAYIIAKNPAWLGGFSGGSARLPRRQTMLDRARIPRAIAPALTGLLLVAALGYFVMTAFALVGAAPAAAGTSTVTIVETPVTWQYSPQVIHVVLGVNSTVVWVSHSISYDSVTSRNGSFDSGPIPPGGRFTLVFSNAGTYPYYCVYHPWMEGTIVVTAPRSAG